MVTQAGKHFYVRENTFHFIDSSCGMVQVVFSALAPDLVRRVVSG